LRCTIKTFPPKLVTFRTLSSNGFFAMSWFSALRFALIFSLTLIAVSAQADAWRFRYSEPSVLTDPPDNPPSRVLASFNARAVSTSADGFWASGLRNDAGTAGVLVRFDLANHVIANVPTQATQALYSNASGALLALDSTQVSGFAANGAQRFQLSLAPGSELGQVALDNAGNALLLRDARAYMLSPFGVNDLGAAVSVAGAEQGGWVGVGGATRRLLRIGVDGTVLSTIALAANELPIAMQANSGGGVRVFLTTPSGLSVAEYAADGAQGTRLTANLNAAQIAGVRKALSAPLTGDGVWRVLLVGSGDPFLVTVSQLGARAQLIPSTIRCEFECRFNGFKNGRSLYLERSANGSEIKVLNLDSFGQVLSDGNETLDSIHASTEVPDDSRVFISGQKLLKLNNATPGQALNTANIIPAVLASVDLIDVSEASLLASINPFANTFRIALISTAGDVVWRRQSNFVLSGSAAIARNAERYCTAFGVRDGSVRVACYRINDNAQLAFDDVTVSAGELAIAPNKIIARMAPDGTLGLLLQRASAAGTQTLEYAQFDADVRLRVRRTLASAAARNEILDLRLSNNLAQSLFLAGGEIIQDRNALRQNFGAGTAAHYSADTGAVLSLSAPARLLRINDSAQNLYQRDGISALESVTSASTRVLRGATELVAVNDQTGALLWRSAGDFAAGRLLVNGDQLLHVGTLNNKIRVQVFNLASGVATAERLFPCGSNCSVRSALFNGRGLRVQLDMHTENGVEMQLVSADLPIPTPALALTQAGLSGAWFDPLTSGQGLNITRIDRSPTIFAGWFTFEAGNTAQNAAGQRWYSLQGDIRPDNAETVQLGIFETVGGTFTQALPAVTSRRVGTATLRLSACDHLTMSYRFDAQANAAAREGQLLLTRLTPANLSCISALAAQAPSALLPVPQSPSSQIEGPWYDPEVLGQGLFFNAWPKFSGLLDAPVGGVFGGWFTYDVQANDPTAQQWFVLQTLQEFSQGEVLAFGIFQSIAGVFDARIAGGVSQVGSGTLVAEGCDRLTMQYQFSGAGAAGAYAGKSGTLKLRRLGGCNR
jgi:hypothetical protein